ncbi:hypothetical protein AB0D74_45785 [Streptomyces sp. NPDC048278]|uniref:hypothetical protein n=1 Tax=Streptomyces sp. NPDC048278 TaxID=3155809 RepID=UPI003433FEB5
MAVCFAKLAGSLSYAWSPEPERPFELTARGTEPPPALTRTADRGLTSDTGYVKVTTTVQVDYQRSSRPSGAGSAKR